MKLDQIVSTQQDIISSTLKKIDISIRMCK